MYDSRTAFSLTTFSPPALNQIEKERRREGGGGVIFLVHEPLQPQSAALTFSLLGVVSVSVRRFMAFETWRAPTPLFRAFAQSKQQAEQLDRHRERNILNGPGKGGKDRQTAVLKSLCADEQIS
jgi:hypothetical protein